MQTVTCTLCGKQHPVNAVVVRKNARVCESCVWELVDELETRGTVHPGSMTAPRAMPCTFCVQAAEVATNVGDLRVCSSCAKALGHLVLTTSRHDLEDIWDVEFQENTSMRKVSELVATELRQGGRTHAQLAIDLQTSGELGQALCEAAIAITSDPDDKVVAEQALGVILGTAGKSTVATLRERIAKKK